MLMHSLNRSPTCWCTRCAICSFGMGMYCVAGVSTHCSKEPLPVLVVVNGGGDCQVCEAAEVCICAVQ